MDPWNCVRKGDCCGRIEAITDGYFCEKCMFFVHKKCSEFSEYIEHPSHSGHILQLHRTRKNLCNLCGKIIENLFYRCEVCDFDMDLCCIKYPPPELIDISEKHHHKLILLKKRIDFDCGAKCGKAGENEYAYKCDECDLAFHMDCVRHPLEVKHSIEYTTIDVGNRVPLPLIHEHLMVPWNDTVKGDCCGRFESITDGFYCGSCEFFVHKKCSQLSKYIQHPSHSRHTLKLRRKLYQRCNLCAKIIMNLFYRCEVCDFDIDLYCVSNPPPEVIQLTPNHKLILLKKRSDFDCHAKCGKSSKNKLAYKCQDCDIAFHVDCVWHPLEVIQPLEVKQPLEANNDKPNDKPMNDWAELQRTLAAMQENIQATFKNSNQANNDKPNDWAELQRTLAAMQENIQTTNHNSIKELTGVVLQQREQFHVSVNDVTVSELNPLAETRVCCGNGAGRHCDRESGFKLDIPEFHGGVKGEEVLDWLIVVEEILEFKNVHEDIKVALVATKFRGKAAVWWLQLKATRARAGKEKVKSWEKLKKLLRRSFLPYNFDRTMSNRLQNLRQGARSVDEYADEFSLLLTRNELFDSELQLVSRFIGGLRPLIRSAMTQFVHSTVAKAHAGAVAFEQELKSEAWSTDTNRFGGMASFPAPETEEDDQNENNLGESPKQGRREFLVEEPKWDTNEHVDTEEGLLEDLTYGVM